MNSGSAARETFSRDDRLRKRREFEECYASGVRVSGRLIQVFLRLGPDMPRIGISVPKRVGNAVTRNRLRRRVREIFRRNRDLFGATSASLVVHVRPAAAAAPFSEMLEEYRRAVARGAGSRTLTGRDPERRDTPSLPARLALLVLGFYKAAISPWLPRACRYEPTCAVYAREAIERYGFRRGSWLSLRRLSRCHPFRPGGLDPVP